MIKKTSQQTCEVVKLARDTYPPYTLPPLLGGGNDVFLTSLAEECVNPFF